jgi:hypothetical protein
MAVPCPHCGQSNEPERDVCWACSQLLKGLPGHPAAPTGHREIGPFHVNVTKKTKIVVNGQEYARMEDVPERFRSILKDSIEQSVTYRVRLQLKDGKTITLASGLRAPEQALFIEQQVRKG